MPIAAAMPSPDSPAAGGSHRVAAEWQPIEHVPAVGLSYDEFLERYLHPGRPVVVTGVAADWPAMTSWTPERLRERLGSKPVPIGYERHVPFDEFIDQVLASSAGTPGPYMYRSFLHEVLPELLPDVIPQNPYAFPRRYASPLMPAQWHRPDGYLKLLIGGVGSKFPVMHFDGDNAHAAITQIHGQKEFVIYAPQDGPFLYPKKFVPNHSMVDDPAQQDRVRFPLLAQARQFRAILEPGDMIFVPARWWHAARALSTSVSVCSNMLDDSNWEGFVREVTRNSKLPAREVKWLRTRLAFTGSLLLALEDFQERSPALAKALRMPALLAPLSARSAPEPSRRQLNIRVPTA